jgi:hypothetical protein
MKHEPEIIVLFSGEKWEISTIEIERNLEGRSRFRFAYLAARAD